MSEARAYEDGYADGVRDMRAEAARSCNDLLANRRGNPYAQQSLPVTPVKAQGVVGMLRKNCLLTDEMIEAAISGAHGS